MTELWEAKRLELEVFEGRVDENDRRSAISNQLENVLLRLDRIRRVILSQSADNATNIVNGEANSITRIPLPHFRAGCVTSSHSTMNDAQFTV